MDNTSNAYWMSTLKLIGMILVVWFIISYGFGIVLAPALNNISLGGYPLGFWFSCQGSIYGFVALIFIYAKLMGNLDEKFDVHED